MVGRQTPILAVIVPLILVFVVDGRRGVKQTWLPALVCGVAFGIAQFVAANYISVPLADIVAALVAAGAVVAAAAGLDARRRCSPPSRPAPRRTRLERSRPQARSGGGAAGGLQRDAATVRAAGGTATQAEVPRDSGAEVAEGLRAVPRDHRDLLDHQHPRGQGVPGRRSRSPTPSRGPGWTSSTPPVTRSSTEFKFNWLPAAGTLMIFAGIITALILKVVAGARRSGPTSRPTSS